MHAMFQSQTRSQSPGDKPKVALPKDAVVVSIADAKPIPWRRHALSDVIAAFNGFNRRREANPLATSVFSGSRKARLKFQSQTRSQSPGDRQCTERRCSMTYVSIADAKPIPWRQHCQGLQR